MRLDPPDLPHNWRELEAKFRDQEERKRTEYYSGSEPPRPPRRPTAVRWRAVIGAGLFGTAGLFVGAAGVGLLPNWIAPYVVVGGTAFGAITGFRAGAWTYQARTRRIIEEKTLQEPVAEQRSYLVLTETAAALIYRRLLGAAAALPFEFLAPKLRWMASVIIVWSLLDSLLVLARLRRGLYGTNSLECIEVGEHLREDEKNLPPGARLRLDDEALEKHAVDPVALGAGAV